MKLHLGIDRSRVILTLLALVIFTSPAFGALVITGGNSISCTLQTASPTSIPITVKLSAAPTGSVVVAATPSSNLLVVTQAVNGAAGNTLATSTVASTSTIWSTGVVFNVSAQAYCANATMGTNSVTVNFIGTGSLTGSQSITLTVTTASYTPTVTGNPVTLACNTSNTSGSAAPQSITIALPVAPPVGSSIVFTPQGWTGGSAAAFPLLLTVPNTPQTPGSFAGITVGIDARPYCALATPGTTTQTFVLHATQTGGTTVTIPDTTISVTFVVTAGPSPLTVSPSAISITCTYNGPGDYTVGQPQYISVTGPPAAAAVFSVNTTVATSTALGFAVLNPSAETVGGTAGVVPINFTIAPNANCGGKTVTGAYPGTIHLVNAPNQEKIINVVLNMVPASPLTAVVNPTTLTYVKGSGTPGFVDVALSNTVPSPPNHFTVDTTSLPTWLTVDTASGMTPRSVRFSNTSMADTMAPGSYSKAIRIQSSGSGDKLVTINMRVSNPPSTLSVSGTPTPGCTVSGPTQSCNWVIGQPLPNLYITVKSTDAPLAYSITTGGALAPIIPTALLGGLAYNFGTTIPVTFNQSVVQGVAPGTMLSGTVSIASGNPSTTYVVTFNITAQAPGAILTGINPTIVPTLQPGQQVQVVLMGSGFVKSSDPSLATTVGIVDAGGVFNPNTNITSNVLNASNILLTITASNPVDSLLPFNTTIDFTVTIGVCNPVGGVACHTATGTGQFTIGAKPIITTVASASSYVQSDNPPVARYDMISIFGTNLCSTCVGPNAVVYGSPQGPNLAYPTSLNVPDGLQHPYTLQVAFKTHTAAPAGTSFTTVYAPLLFATNNQINLLVPSTIPASGLVDLEVSFGPVGALVPGNVYPVTAVTSNPGLFTLAASGQGSGAILDKNYAVVGPANPVAMHGTADSDPVMIYMTGLGTPLSAGDNSLTNGSWRWATDCMAMAGTTGYIGSLANVTGITATTVDGMILQSSVINAGNLVPCLHETSQPPEVYFGGVKGTVTYAGWVADSIAGLYQVNATLPKTAEGTYKAAGATCASTGATLGSGSITSALELPICVKSKDGRYSQTGVTIAVAPRLYVTEPADATGTPKVLSEKVGKLATTGATHKVNVSEGTPGYTFALTSGALPSGLTLATDGQIAGTPATGTVGRYPITVTATDSLGMTGMVSFPIDVTGGLFVTHTITLTTGVGQIIASGGTPAYTYTLAEGSPALPGTLHLNSDGTITGTGATSTDTIVFKATDANGVTGTVSVTLNIP